MHARENRQSWGDIAKGVGILAIVTTHVVIHDETLSTGTFKTLIGLVSMPTFFMLSGLMYRPAGISNFVIRRVRSIAVPYLAFLALVALLVAARDVILPNPSMPHIRQFLWGGDELKGDFGTFWFLSSLFFTQVLYNLVASRYPDPAGRPLLLLALAMLLGGAALDHTAINWALPWSMDRLPYTLPLFWFGHLLQRESCHRTLIYCGLAGISAAAFLALAQGYAFRIAMKDGVIDPPALGLLVGFVSARLALSLYRLLANVPWLSKALVLVGRRSLVILCLHQFVHFTLRRLGIETSWILILFAFTLPLFSVPLFMRFGWARMMFLGMAKSRVAADTTPLRQTAAVM